VKKLSAINCPTEAQEQTTLFEWAAWNIAKYPELKCLYAIPNGGSRNRIEAVNLKKQGVRKGVSDIHLPVARRGYHGLWLELKRIAGGRIEPEQANWIELMRLHGHYAVIAYGFEDAKKYLEWYLG
jgi:hypothetical protein